MLLSGVITYAGEELTLKRQKELGGVILLWYQSVNFLIP